MSRGRHRQQHLKSVRRPVAIIASAALVAAIPIGVVTVWPDGDEDRAAAQRPSAPDLEERKAAVSRSSDRTPIVDPSMLPDGPTVNPTPSATPTKSPDPTPEETPEESEGTEETEETPSPEPTPEPTVVGQRYATVVLNVRAEPRENAEVKTVLSVGTEVDITDVTEGPWVRVTHEDGPAWVSSNYLSETEPEPEPEPDAAEESSESGGISSAPCPSGSGVESGLTQDGIRVHRAVCAQFPDVSSYGGVRSGSGEHSQGRAVDMMVSNSSLGDAIAEWVRENHQELGVSEVIWAQRIWTVQRSSEGWRAMEDRGSDTANHYDHVHVTVYGDSGSS